MRRRPPKGKPFKAGQDPRRHDGRVVKLGPALRRMLREGDQLERIASAVVAGIKTGWLPLEVPDIGRSNGGGFELRFNEWIVLLELAGIVDESAAGTDATVAGDVRAMSDSELAEIVSHGRAVLARADQDYTDEELTAIIADPGTAP